MGTSSKVEDLLNGFSLDIAPNGLKVLPELLEVNVPVHVGVNVPHDVLQLPLLPEDVDCDHGEDGEDEEAVHDGEASRQVVQGFPSPGSQTEVKRQM